MSLKQTKFFKWLIVQYSLQGEGIRLVIESLWVPFPVGCATVAYNQ